MNEHEKPLPTRSLSLAEMEKLIALYWQEHEADIGKVVDTAPIEKEVDNDEMV